ncbi:acyltransferase [Synechocystis sp. B12]|nr:acyltransferase [Synechocystis sp. B12]
MDIVNYFLRIIREFLWLLSELEVLISSPNYYLPFRRIYLYWQKVDHGKMLWIGRGFRLIRRGNLVLGDRCALGDYTKIANHALIKIGDDFIGATGLNLDSGTHDPITLEPQVLPISIGNRVWCGINVTILAGVTIGDDVVLGAGSLVCKDIPPSSLAVGVPAKVIKSLNRSENIKMWTWVSSKNLKR